MPSPDTATNVDERAQQAAPSTSSSSIRSTITDNQQNTTAHSVGQYEHITVMTQLQQQPAPSTIPQHSASQTVVASSCTSGYATNINSLHVCPPSTITQQVQLTVPALSSVPGSNVYPQARMSISNHDQEKLICTNQRQKVPPPTILTVVGKGTLGEDGPTVRQHLQYQQKARMRHQLETQGKIRPEEKIDANDVLQQNWQNVTAAASSTLQKTQVQRIYAVRGGALQKPHVGVDRLRQQQIFTEKQQQQLNQEQILQNASNVQKLRMRQLPGNPIANTTSHLKPAVCSAQNDAQLTQKRIVHLKREQPTTMTHVCFTKMGQNAEESVTENNRAINLHNLNSVDNSTPFLAKTCVGSQQLQQKVQQPIIQVEQFGVQGHCNMNEGFVYPTQPQVSSSIQSSSERNTLNVQNPAENSLVQQDLNASQARQRLARVRVVQPTVTYEQQSSKDYSLRIYWLKRTTKALIYKNAALCDEVARLNQRIQTVTEERKFLAKRLQHYERNRVRRILSKIKKRKASELAARANSSQSGSDSAILQKETLKLNPPSASSVAEFEESDNDSEKTVMSSCAASPITSTSANANELPA